MSVISKFESDSTSRDHRPLLLNSLLNSLCQCLIFFVDDEAASLKVEVRLSNY